MPLIVRPVRLVPLLLVALHLNTFCVFRKDMSIMHYKNIFFTFFLAIFFMVSPGVVKAEYIDTFASDISISKDGTASITERIAYFFSQDKHGIFRCLPTIHQDKASSVFKERYIDIEVTSIRMDAQDVPYVVDSGTKELCIKIGDPESTIDGLHQYEIAYTVGGAVTYQQYGGAEWYWNVTGNVWEVPIRSVVARVTAADPILLRERACYRDACAGSCFMHSY